MSIAQILNYQVEDSTLKTYVNNHIGQNAFETLGVQQVLDQTEAEAYQLKTFIKNAPSVYGCQYAVFVRLVPTGTS